MAYSGSASDRLTAVREAINDCLSAQSYSSSGRSKMMAQLRDLRIMEKELQEEVAQAAAGQMCGLGIQTRPS